MNRAISWKLNKLSCSKKITECDEAKALLKTEQLLKIKSEESCESGLVELQSLKLNFEKEVERNESLETELNALKAKIQDFENTSIETKQQIINWQEKLKESNAEIVSHQNQIAIRKMFNTIFLVRGI